VNFTKDANYKTYGSVHKYHDGGEDYYVSNAERYDAGTDEVLPNIGYIDAGVTTDRTAVKKITWVLYCYPTGIPIPTTTCS
jgi:hypothetical protein